MTRSMRRFLPVLFLFAAAWLLAGCSTTDDASNRSERPWNSPHGWEHGVPASMMEGR